MIIRNTNRIPYLDGIRGFAISFVLIGHLLAFRADYGRWGHPLASLGVLIFFVLSGYLITRLLLLEKKNTGRISLKNFYTRRVLRIFPALFFFLFIIALLIKLNFITDVRWHSLFASLLFMRNLIGQGQTIDHMWSLSLEEQFYIIWPPLLLLFDKRPTLRLGIILAILGIAWRFLAMNLQIYPLNSGFFYIRSDFRYDGLLLGAIIALHLDQPEGLGLLFGRMSSLQSTILTLSSAALLLSWSLVAFSIQSLQPAYLTIQTYLAGTMLFSLTASPLSIIHKFLSNRFLVWVGTLSYSIYLWQQIFLVTREPDWGWARQFPGLWIGILSTSLISYYLIEKPFLRLKNRYAPL